MTATRKAIFLDRDGTLITDFAYNASPDNIILMPRVGSACVMLQTLGFELIVVTNQSGIGRGLIPPDVTEKQHIKLRKCLRLFNVEILDIKFCPHIDEDNCDCRKPRPGMILEAARQHNINLGRSWMVGDKNSDVDAGIAAGVKTCILKQSYLRADLHSQDLLEMARQLCKKKIYEFTCHIAGVEELTDELCNAVYEAGCDDGLLGIQNGICYVDFHREAENLEAAISSASYDLQRAGLKVKKVIIDNHR